MKITFLDPIMQAGAGAESATATGMVHSKKGRRRQERRGRAGVRETWKPREEGGPSGRVTRRRCALRGAHSKKPRQRRKAAGDREKLSVSE